MGKLNVITISLKTKVEKTENELTVEYEIENLTEQILYIWDRMIDFNDNGQFINDELAYVIFEEPETVNIIRANLPFSNYKFPSSEKTPFVRTIPAKSKITGKIILKLPIKEFSPYFHSINEKAFKIKKCSEIRILLGWSEFREGMEISEQNVYGEKVLLIRGDWEEPYHKLIERRIPISVELCVYRSDIRKTDIVPLKNSISYFHL